jgi:hypothetical protein
MMQEKMLSKRDMYHNFILFRMKMKKSAIVTLHFF